MHPTAYPHVNQLLDDLLSHMQQVLGSKLVGLYLFGSLVAGDFDEDISDIDLLAATADDINESEFDALHRMHRQIISRYPQWRDRLEIAYLSLHGLSTFKTQTSRLGIISPGEPFHIIEAGKDWLINWHVVREQGLTLYGPPPRTIIAPTSDEEFVQSVKGYLGLWYERMEGEHTRPSQAYAILTMCRALYTVTHGKQISKIQAAAWAMRELPEWASLIQNALVWRQAWRDKNIDHATMPETRRFVYFILDRILA
jgi:predicted nucleotidyltransferase